jgi:arsenate reductase
MSDEITVYQKPTCTKCRSTLKILRERGVAFDAVDLFERRLTARWLGELVAKLGLAARDIVRWDEPIARELGLKKRDLSEAELLKVLAEHPALIQRPIVVRGERAVLGRPPENVVELLDSDPNA